MQYEFQLKGVKYVLDFDDPDAKLCAGIGIKVYENFNGNLSFTSTIRVIRDNKIIWETFDSVYVPEEVQEYCNKIVKNKAFL